MSPINVPVGDNKTALPPVNLGTRLANSKAPTSKKVVFVTGGASGIGARVALKSAAEGADVVLAGTSSDFEAALSF